MQVMPVIEEGKIKSMMKNCTLEKRIMLEERAAPTKPWGWEGSCRNLVSSGINPSAPSLICCVMVRFCQSQKVRVSPYELGTLAGLKPYKAGTVCTNQNHRDGTWRKVQAYTSCSLADTCKYQDSYLSNLAPVWAMTSGLYSVLNDHHAGFAPYHFAFHIAVYTESTEKLTEACQAW